MNLIAIEIHAHCRCRILLQMTADETLLTEDTIDQHIVCDGPEHYRCTICQAIVKNRPHIRRHIKSVHLRIKNHKCLFCLAAFFRKEDLRRHEKRCKVKKEMNYDYYDYGV